MKLQINYQRNPHQELFHTDLATKLLHLSGGYGSGKSHACVMKVVQLSAINKHTDGGLLCPTYADFKKDMLPLFEKIFEENRITFQYHRQDHYFKFPWTKRKLWVASAENALRGPNWGYAVINELTLISLYRYRELLGRVRDKHAVIPQIASVGTPEGTASEYYDFFIENPPKDLKSKVLYGRTRDNQENLDPGYIPMLEASYDKTMLNAYLEGLWVNMNSNQFYYAFSTEKNEDKTIMQDFNLPVLVGLDFNVEYMTATLWQKRGEHLFGFGEITIENNADTQKMAEALKNRGIHPYRATIYPDPAGSARSTKGLPDHEILRQAGFDVVSRSTAPRMRERQLNMNNLFDKGFIKFNPEAMPALRRDLLSVEQDTVTLEKIKKNKKLTHSSDGLDYLCDVLFPFSGRRTRSEVIKFR